MQHMILQNTFLNYSFPPLSEPPRRPLRKLSNTSRSRRLAALQQIGIEMPQSSVVSDACRLCRDYLQPHQQPEYTTTCHITAAGDWLSEATLLGLSGPKGRHFCNFCSATLSSLQKGQPHSPVLLSRYAALVGDQQQHIFQLRTLQGIRESNKKFQLSGENTSKVADFNNCLNPPILPGEGCVFTAMSCTPLHVFLGLGDQVVKLLEKEAAALDEEVKLLRGLQLPELQGLLECTATESEKVQVAHEQATEALCHEEEVATQLDDYESCHSALLKLQQHDRRVHRSAEHAAVRRGHRDLLRKLKEARLAVKRAKSACAAAEKAFTDAKKSLDAAKGPFITDLHKTLDSLSLKRCAYHGGAFTGNDINKILQRDIYMKLVSVINPRKICLADGSCKKIGNTRQCQKVATLFKKLSQVYELATANRSLCRHEVAILSVRCYSLGCFFPTNFPEESVKPKLHLLVHHFPQKAFLQGSIGLETEQLIESMHPFVNRKARQYTCVRDPLQQMGLIAQSQWVGSSTAT